MNKKTITIATRNSQLALWQAEFVKAQLEKHYPDHAITLLPLTTSGDKFLETSLTKIGGKGLFTKELERALQDNQADIAVHSMKDLPVDMPEDMLIAAVCQRANPRDALLANTRHSFDELPTGAIIGTSSLRRQSQLLAKRDDLTVKLLRGNVNTRLKKLKAGEYDAIILACAGLERLGFEKEITLALEPEIMLPAVGQGAIGIECRKDDIETQEKICVLNDQNTETCVIAERVVSRELGGSCQVPLAAYAVLKQGKLWLRALVGTPDGKVLLRAEASGLDATTVGLNVANLLRDKGAEAILARLSINP